jgi:hypothetical protein
MWWRASGGVRVVAREWWGGGGGVVGVCDLVQVVFQGVCVLSIRRHTFCILLIFYLLQFLAHMYVDGGDSR